MIVEEREYARLLGYPWGTALEGAVGERAAQAAEWYERHCKARVYCVSPDDTGYTVTAITAGHEVDAEVDRLWNAGHVDEAYFLDRYAAAVVEKLAQDLGPYESPGTGKLPFEMQWRLFLYIASLNPEIEILASGMLKPKNSILAIVRAGIKPAATGRLQREPRSRGLYARVPCTRCDLAGCSFRRLTS